VAVQDRMTPRNLYLYLVCLIMLLVGVFAAVVLVRSALGIAYPDPALDFGWYAYTPIEEASGSLPDEAVEAQRRQEIKETVAAGTALLLAGGVFALHWRRAQAERSLPVAAPEVPAGPPAP
jgi:hypothetical protein